jgi:2-succinyl-6-hydroxy-2,4-cyclohexadiene-1-carboxylate synthase
VRGCVDRHRIDVRGMRYAVRVHGGMAASATAVLLHGFAGSADDWREIDEPLAAAGIRTIAVDLPGHGGTDAPTDLLRYAPGETADDLLSILSAVGVGCAHWVGYSMGARIALRVALDAPVRTASLALESASTGIGDDVARAERCSRDEALASEIERRGIEWFVPYWESRPIFATQAFLPAERQEAQRARRLRQRPEGLARSLRASGQGATPDLTPQLGAIACPALLIAGTEDAPYVAHARRIAGELRSASVRIVPEAGHNVHLERPEEFTRALLDHLASVRREDPAGAPSSLPRSLPCP